MKKYKKALFIYNPLSGNRDIATELDKIVDKFMSKDIIIIPIRLENEVYDEVKDIMKNFDYDFIIASGGDGTVDFVASEIINSKIDKPYAVIGSGTCNNFASNIGMPSGVYKTIDEISKFNIGKVDVGKLNTGEFFLSSLAVGIFAETSFETNSDLKEWLGPVAYYLQGLSQLSNIKTNKFKIKTKDKTIEEEAYMVIVLNGTNVGSIEGLFEDEVDIQDGLFEMIIVKETNPVDLANLLVMVAKGEDFTKSNMIEILKSCEFEIDCEDRQIAVSIDGEKGPSLPLKLNVMQKCIKVIVAEEK